MLDMLVSLAVGLLPTIAASAAFAAVMWAVFMFVPRLIERVGAPRRQ